MELAVLESLKIDGYVVTNFKVSAFNFNWMFFFLAGNRTSIKVWMSFNFKQNKPQAVALAALEHQKNPHTLTMRDLL